MTQNVDPGEFQQNEREAWDSVAAGWYRWWRTFEAGAQSLNERLVELAGVAPGQRCLDLATGIGEPALTAARVTGASGSVLATDLSPEMLELGRKRMAEAGIAHVEFAEMDAEQLDVEPGSFDAAFCRWGLMLMLRPVLVAKNVHRALREGGGFAVAVWGKPDEVPFISLAPRAVQRVLDLPPADPNEPGPFRLGDVDELSGVLDAAGFSAVEVVEGQVTLTFSEPRDYVRFLCDMSSTLRKNLGPLDDAEQQRVLAAIEEAAEDYSAADGTVQFHNRVLCASGLAG